MLALTLFTLGSLACGFASSIEQLIFFRVLQGIGGGMLAPVGQAMLFRAFPPHERAKASAVLVIPIAIAPTIGPVLGGFLVDYVSWHWIFLVNIPVGIVALVFAGIFLKEHTEPLTGGFDLPGFLLTASSLPILLYGLSRAPHDGWTSPVVLGLFALGTVLLALMVVVETRVPHPMLALGLFRDRMFRSANIVSFI